MCCCTKTSGHSPFAEWLDDLDRQVAAKATIAIERLRLGNLSKIKSVGAGVQDIGSTGGQATGFISAAIAKSW